MNRIALETPEDAGADQPMNPPGIERLSSISVPVLIIYGDLDQPPTLDIAKVLSHELRQSKTVVMSDTAHLPMMERPQEFSQIVLSFLGSIESPA
jgi:pimeloyl-ACP methyl ester carboxylesterase